jgi:AIR synthase-related protein
MSLKEIISALKSGQYFTHKMDISHVLSTLDKSLPNGVNRIQDAVILGDDCAAIPDGDGFLLYAIEGMIGEFVRELPWFAGYSSVMVNISDIYAMGGRPIAVVDALWSDGQLSAEKLLQGMAAASKVYGVPIVGGHSNTRSSQSQLAVSILGRAKKLLSSFNARPNDKLMMAIDLRGKFEGVYPYWNASSKAMPLRLREDLEILPRLAEQGLCDAAKDISMAGVLGTALMLLECSGVGANIHLDQIPIPENVPMLRWLSAFPSYGFLLSVRPEHAEAVKKIFHERYLACAEIGEVVSGGQVNLTQGNEEALLWGFDKANFILPIRASA